MMNRSGQEYVIGQQVAGRIERLLPYGVFVRLEDGSSAYIRRWELTWAGNIDPRELWQKGDQIEGVVLKLAGPGQNMELSHRKIWPDPWRGFADKFHQGDVVEGTVKSIMGYGVFVEVVPGIDGLVPLRDLAIWEVEQPEELVWIGDQVEAVITHLDHPARKLRLSIRARLRQLETVAGIMDYLALSPSPEASPGEPDAGEARDRAIVEGQPALMTEPELDPLVYERVGPILVVDDYDEVRLPLVEWLRHRGFTVSEARDAEEAARKIQGAAYNLLLVDLNLPGQDGLALLRQIRQKDALCRVAVMSSADWLEVRSTEIEAIGVVEVFVKPLNLDEIEQLLGRLGRGERIPLWRMAPEGAEIKIPKSFQKLKGATSGQASLAGQLYTGLGQLVAITRAETGFIFQRDPLSQAISMMAYVGKKELNKEAVHSLEASPVRDVISEGRYLLEARMEEHVRERFSKLLDLLPFESCLGVPITAQGEISHALFLTHRKAGVFNRYHLRDALATSALFTLAIEREAMEQRFQGLNKLQLAGQLASGLSHEVNNKITGLDTQLHNLQADCRKFEGQGYQPPDFGEISQAVNQLSSTFDDLKRTVQLFQQLVRPQEERQAPLHEIIGETVFLLKHLAGQQEVRIETELSCDLAGAVGGVTQLQQIFLNLMLNAIQQMALKPGCGKRLNISTSCEHADEAYPIKIRFSDSGPGIHRRLWEKIFDLGFTTRPGGTGQGLYLARGLVESLGGKVGVERSIVPLGTTFLVELPSYHLRGA